MKLLVEATKNNAGFIVLRIKPEDDPYKAAQIVELHLPREVAADLAVKILNLLQI